jgi:hypothetical protein
MIPEGNYRARAVEGALGYTSKGKEQVAIRFTILEGDQAGQYLTWYGYFSEKTVERTFESLEFCGWDGDDLADLSGIDKNEVSIKVEHEQDEQGEVRARIRWINSGGGLAMKERMDEGQAKAFAARMRGELVARKQRKGAAAQAARPPAQRRQPPLQAPPADASDDIPF